MTITVPALADIAQQGATAIATRLQGADATPPRSVLGVLNKVVAGAVDGLYGAIQSAAADIIWDTAQVDARVRWASFFGIFREPPKAAGGGVIFTGSSAAGTQVPELTVLTRSDGISYVLSAAVTLVNGTGTGTVTCASAGAVTNTPAGGALKLATTVPGVAGAVTVDANGLGGGADLESPQSLLNRLLLRVRRPPQGGSDADYREWALAVPGVTRAWVYPGWQGTGTVGLTFMMDGRADPVPQAADAAAAQAAIAAERPVAAPLFVFVPTVAPENFIVHLNPDSAAARGAVQAELASLIANECTPGGTFVVDGVPISGGLLYLSHIRAAISAAAGVEDFTLSAPAADVQAGRGQITTMGTISWV